MTPPHRILVCGGRDFNDEARLASVLNGYAVAEIIQGGARGADRLAFEWAANNLVPTRTFPAAWDLHGKAAGPIRNHQMLREGKPDLVIAFPGGRGTAHMVSIAKAAGITVIEVTA